MEFQITEVALQMCQSIGHILKIDNRMCHSNSKLYQYIFMKWGLMIWNWQHQLEANINCEYIQLFSQ